MSQSAKGVRGLSVKSTVPKYFLKNIKTTLKNLEYNFLEPQLINYQNTGVILAKSFEFCFQFRSVSSNFALLATVFIKSFHLIA